MKQFKNRAEVVDQQEFQQDQPICVESYCGLIGWYSFEKEEMRCCSLKDTGTLCKTPHKKGWVARVANGAFTLIGGDCAKKKYDADSSIIRDINQAQKLIDEEVAKHRLAELLADRDRSRVNVVAAHKLLDERRRALQSFMELVGKKNQARFEELARTSGEVVVEGRTPAERDSDGEIVMDARIVSITMPPIASVGVCKPSFVAQPADELRALRKLYDEADSLIDEGGEKGRRALIAGLQRTESTISMAESAVTALDTFLSCDLTTACFLVTDWKDRCLVGKVAIDRLGGMGDPKAWIQRIEAGLRRKHNVTKIAIGVSR